MADQDDDGPAKVSKKGYVAVKKPCAKQRKESVSGQGKNSRNNGTAVK